ncbi:MAG: aminoacyl-tRNA hydrolase [Candidatus Omnitrophica bacterium]|nr:aminoacyl-tRNA hydrolase [Candidatus Omnitrophota bacterium]MBU1127701.1 aminoacyl-tRNA hydrolase [Candidatus Omnitrophota bacterium]MBU1784260.1 aminoacyl-tRNA hydrolase [Candidatus Omnitrophota bacterium]MBU1851279.1 aminoacyl-tRNA hydrolase [Candidatus Omnitrophota bacterium]
MSKIIVGLGNPGFRYRRTKHNVGFRVLDGFAEKHGMRVRKKGFQGIYGIGRVLGEEVVLFKPMTYMNLSGEPVEAICASRLSGIEELLVVSDDLDFSVGVIRIREKGSSGGHNGLQSIIEKLGYEFNRLRVGIGTSDMPEDKTKYVLSAFSREDKVLLGDAIEKSMECIETWIARGVKEAMNRYN